jgi:FkbM family methyltransferase
MAITIKNLKTTNGEHIVEMSDGIKFKSRTTKQVLLNDLDQKYIVSHYEVEKPRGGGIWRAGQFDNLHNLQVDQETKENLFNYFPIKKGDTVLELGAYAGFGTLKLSQLVGENGQVITIEGDGENFNRCVENIKFNNKQNIKIYNKFIWSSPETKSVWKTSLWSKALVPNWGGTETKIETDSLDNILEQNNIKNIDFMTMEINLAEYHALVGASAGMI